MTLKTKETKPAKKHAYMGQGSHNNRRGDCGDRIITTGCNKLMDDFRANFKAPILLWLRPISDMTT